MSLIQQVFPVSSRYKENKPALKELTLRGLGVGEDRHQALKTISK